MSYNEVSVQQYLRGQLALDKKYGPYDDIAARDAIPEEDRYDLMQVGVIDGDGTGTPKIFFLKNGLLNVNWSEISEVFGEAGIENRYADITALTTTVAQANQTDGGIQFVLDPSDDPAIASGYAYYEYLNTTNGNLTDYRILSKQHIIHDYGIIYLSKTGSDAKEGSVNLPVLTLQKAVDLAVASSKSIEIVGEFIEDSGTITDIPVHPNPSDDYTLTIRAKDVGYGSLLGDSVELRTVSISNNRVVFINLQIETLDIIQSGVGLYDNVSIKLDRVKIDDITETIEEPLTGADINAHNSSLISGNGIIDTGIFLDKSSLSISSTSTIRSLLVFLGSSVVINGTDTHEIETLLVESGYLEIETGGNLEVSTSFTHTGTKFVNKSLINVTGSETVVTGEFANTPNKLDKVQSANQAVTSNVEFAQNVNVLGDLQEDGTNISEIYEPILGHNNYSYGESYFTNYRDRVLDDAGTYFPNSGGYEFGKAKQLGIDRKMSLMMIPSGVKATKLYSAKPQDGTGDFTVARNGIATYIDEDGVIQTAVIDTPRVDYTDGDGVLLLEPASTNLIEESEAFGRSYWTKSDATIEGDPSTVTGGDLSTSVFTDQNSSFDTFDGASADGFHAISTGGSDFATTQDDISVVDGNSYLITWTPTLTSGTAITFIVRQNKIGGTVYFDSGNSAFTSGQAFFTASVTEDVTMYFIVQTAEITVADFTVKEVQGFSAPDGSLNAFKLVATGSNGFLQRITTGTSGVDYSNSIWLKRVTGTGNVLLKNADNVESVITLTSSWQKFDNTDESSSTSIYTGVKLATSGDEVMIFGAQLEERSFPTSYIPTSGATASRIADAVTGAVSISNINSESGGLIVELTGLANGDSFRTLGLSDGTDVNYVHLLYRSTVNEVWFQTKVGGIQTTLQLADVQQDIKHILGISWDDDSLLFYIDGVEKYNQAFTSFLSNVLDRLNFSQWDGSGEYFFGKFNKTLVFNRKLTQAELLALTTS